MDELVSLKLPSTWNTIKRAAEIRKHNIINADVDPDSGVPDLKYHRLCYQTFTMKSKLERIQNQNLKNELELKSKISTVLDYDCSEETPETDKNRPKRQSLKGDSLLLPHECIFCKKKNKYKNRKLEHLVKCVEKRAIDTIKHAATAANDFSMLGLLSKDLRAVEAMYHASCYKLYTKPKQSIVSDSEEASESEYKKVEMEAFQGIIRICHNISAQPTVLPLTSLQKQMEEVFVRNNMQMTASTKKHLRRNIEKHIPDVCFINVNGSVFVYSKQLSIDTLVEHFIKVQEKLKVLKRQNEDYNSTERSIVDCAICIRHDIMQLEDTMPWPPQPEDLSPEKVKVPESLILLLRTIFDGQQSSESPRSS